MTNTNKLHEGLYNEAVRCARESHNFRNYAEDYRIEGDYAKADAYGVVADDLEQKARKLVQGLTNEHKANIGLILIGSF